MRTCVKWNLLSVNSFHAVFEDIVINIGVFDQPSQSFDLGFCFFDFKGDFHIRQKSDFSGIYIRKIVTI